MLPLKDSLSYCSCVLTLSLALPLCLVFFFSPPGMNVCFIGWFDIMKHRGRSQPACCSRCISQQVSRRNVATQFLKMDYRKSLRQLSCGDLLSSLTCSVCMIKTRKSQTGLSSLKPPVNKMIRYKDRRRMKATRVFSNSSFQ